MPDIERASMNSIIVQKDRLLQTLLENRDKHVAAYDEAVTGYRTQAITILEKYITKIRDGEVTRVDVDLPVPESHVEDYDLALANLEWSILDTVELDRHEFDQYVRDNWRWKKDFLRMSAGYSTHV